jgi:hypothetical protein
LENAASILREMQEKSRDKGPAEGQAEEREACYQGHMPELFHKRFQDRGMKSMESFIFFDCFLTRN